MKISFYQEAANIILSYIYIYIKNVSKRVLLFGQKDWTPIFFLIKKSFLFNSLFSNMSTLSTKYRIFKKKIILKTKDIFNQLNQIQYKRSNNFYEKSKIGIPLYPTETFKQKEF